MKTILNFLTVATFLCFLINSYGNVPGVIYYQGYVTGPAPNYPSISGEHDMRFGLFNSLGTQVWGYEFHDDVSIHDGLFVVTLGPFPTDFFVTYPPPLWMEIWIDTNNTNGFELTEKFTPRMLLAGSPYTFVAEQAQKVEPGALKCEHSREYDFIVDQNDPLLLCADYYTIEDAVDALYDVSDPPDPDLCQKQTIFVRCGEYFPTKILSLPSNTALIGENTDAVIINFSNAPLCYVQAIGSNIRIENITVEHSNNTINFTGGINCRPSSSFVVIKNCICHDNFDGIQILNSSKNTIEGNYCNNNKRYGIYLYNNSLENTIVGNRCEGNGFDGIIVSNGSLNNVVTQNYCGDNWRHGIKIEVRSHYNTVTSNKCIGNSNNGIQVSSVRDNIVSANSCYGNTGAGIFLYGDGTISNTLTGNVCSSSNYGIYLSSSKKNSISENIIHDCSIQGILLQNSSYNSVGTNNVDLATTSTANVAIMLTCSSFNTLCNNNCNSLNGIGIEVDDDSDRNTITGCQCKGVQYGIRINVPSCDYNIILGCQISPYQPSTSWNLGTLSTVDHNIY